MARLVVRARPGARRSGFTGWFGDVPKFAVAAPAVDGRANDELVAALASVLGVPKRSVRLVGGRAARTKRLEIDGMTDAALTAAVESLNPR